MNVTLTLATRYGLNILGLLAVSVALYLGRSIFIPLTISILLAAILYPLAVWMQQRLRMPWFFACLSVILLLVLIHSAIIFAVAASVPQIVNRLPDTEEKWAKKYEEFAQGLKNAFPVPTDSAVPLDAQNSPFFRSIKNVFSPENVGSYLKTFAGETFALIAEVVLVLFVILFLLLEGELLAKKVRSLFGTSEENARRVTNTIAQMAAAIRNYLVWRTIINVLLGLFVGLMYKLCNLEQWYLWMVLTMVLNYVPYIGTIAAGAPPVAEALIAGNPQLAMGIVIAYTAIVTFEGYWIVPRVMGKTMDLNATTVMVACLYWHLVWGLAGLFLAMPLMAAVKAVLLNVDGWQAWGDLLSSADSPVSQERLAEIRKAVPDPEATTLMDAGPEAASASVRTS